MRDPSNLNTSSNPSVRSAGTQEADLINRMKTQKVFHEIGCLSREEILRQYRTLAWGYINQSETEAIEYAVGLCAARRQPDSLLDIGCGTGRLLVPLSKRYRSTGLDFSQSFLDQLKKEHPEIPTVFGDATALPFPDQSFGMVLCVRLIQHLTDAQQAQFFAECRRVLKPGGFLIVLNYNALSFLTLYKKLCQSAWQAWSRWPLKKWNWEVDDYHFAGEMSSLARKGGFKVVKQFACTAGEPDLDRFLKIDDWFGRHAPWAQAFYYRCLMFLNPVGRYFPFNKLFSRVIVVAERE